MFGTIAKGVGAIVVGAVVSLVAITWTDEATAEGIMENLRRENDQFDPEAPVDARRAHLRQVADQLVANLDEKILLNSTMRDLRKDIDKFISSVH